MTIRHYHWERLLCILAAAVFALAVTAFIATFAAAVLPAFAQSASAAGTGYSVGELMRITAYTFAESLLSVLLAVAVGLPAAYYCSHKNFFLRRVIVSLSSVPLCIPPLLIALGYIATFGMSGTVNKILMSLLYVDEPPLTFLYSFWGIVLTQGFYNFPLVMTTVANSWLSLDRRQEESARLLGAGDFRIFRTITIYQLMPSIVSGAIPVFIYCFFSFMIVLLFGTAGGTTLEIAIYHAGRSVMNFRSAAVLALLETSCAAVILFVYTAAEHRTSSEDNTLFSADIIQRKKLTKTERAPAYLFLFVIALFFLLPLASIAIGAFTSRRGGAEGFSLAAVKRMISMRGFAPAFLHTIETSCITALLCTVAGLVWAMVLRLSKRQKNTLLATVPLLPMAVSSVVTGIGMTLLVRRGSPVHLIIAQTALYWPFAYRQIHASASKIPQSVIDAATLLSYHRTDRLFRILLPYTKRGILSALGFCFAMSAGDATLPLVLALQKFDTLSLFTYRLAGSYRFPEACASGLVLGLICMTVFSVASHVSFQPNSRRHSR